MQYVQYVCIQCVRILSDTRASESIYSYTRLSSHALEQRPQCYLQRDMESSEKKHSHVSSPHLRLRLCQFAPSSILAVLPLLVRANDARASARAHALDVSHVTLVEPPPHPTPLTHARTHTKRTHQQNRDESTREGGERSAKIKDS